MKYSKMYLLVVPLLAVGYYYFGYFFEEKIDYSSQIKPILNTHCISCHGGVKKEAGFSLLFEEEAKSKTKSGKPAIIPGHADQSEFIKRLTHPDPDERMPYKKAPLTKEDIKLLTDWVDQGAVWGEHWAFQPVQKVEVPSQSFMASFFSIFDWLGSNDTIGNEIDHFIDKKLDEIGLKANDEAPKASLLRRLCLDITGLPADKKLSDWFLNNNDPNAYQTLVDTLLARATYGEKWATNWLDLARYADSKGYERDADRNIWQYRDWVIRALNQDMPYSQFITEQLAGDLLPNATDDQLLATGFLRNTMTNDEGGTDNEEFRIAAVVDRINTNWAVLQSSSFACVQCHSHPYDPFRHEEYYKYMAFFNQTADQDTYEDYPIIKHFPDRLQPKYDSLKTWLKANISTNEAKYWLNLAKTWQPAYNFITTNDHKNGDLLDNKWLGLRQNGQARLPQVDFTNATQIILRKQVWQKNSLLELRLDNPNGQLVLSIRPDTTSNKYRNFTYAIPNIQGKHDLYFIAKNNKAKPNDNLISFHWMALTPDFPKGKDQANGLALRQFNEVNNYFDFKTATPIILDYPANMARQTHVFVRGNWTSLGAKVTPDIPAIFGGLPQHFPKNRLGLAQWMVSEKNPLTARTLVNRVWEQLFGIGLVETLEDFGTQGLNPSHRELLDYLSYQVMHELGWSQKALIRKIVLSKAYKRNTIVDEDMQKADAANQYLARGPRVRLSGEQLRDQALAISGLLDHKMYGPSVRPEQPEGVVANPYSPNIWNISDGTDRYRRSVYTYWIRTSPYPMNINFDAGSREVCVVRRIRTNTPLQALNTLNDPVFVEAARHWAWSFEQSNLSEAEVIESAYQQLLGQEISVEKQKILLELYKKSQKEFAKKEKAMQFLKVCDDDQTQPKNAQNLAAFTVVFNTMLNLDEVMIK